MAFLFAGGAFYARQRCVPAFEGYVNPCIYVGLSDGKIAEFKAFVGA